MLLECYTVVGYPIGLKREVLRTAMGLVFLSVLCFDRISVVEMMMLMSSETRKIRNEYMI